MLNPTTRTIQLNGSASQDPEGRPLEYVWNIDGVDHPTKGILVQLDPAEQAGQPDTYTIYLKANDPAGLEGTLPDPAGDTVNYSCSLTVRATKPATCWSSRSSCMALLLTLGLALLKQVDSEQAEGGRQRARESSFQVAEGALNAQVFQLSTRWPDSAAPVPDCVHPGHDGPAGLPEHERHGLDVPNVDQATSTAWTTQVRDNAELSPNYWSDSLVTSDRVRRERGRLRVGRARPRS